MLSGRVVRGLLYHDYRDDRFYFASAPLLIRGLHPGGLAEYIQFFGLGWVLLVASAFHLRRARVSGVPAVALAAVLMERAFVLEQVLALLHWSIPWGNRFSPGKLAEPALLVVAAGVLCWRTEHRAIVLKACVAVYATSLSVSRPARNVWPPATR